MIYLDAFVWSNELFLLACERYGIEKPTHLEPSNALAEFHHVWVSAAKDEVLMIDGHHLTQQGGGSHNTLVTGLGRMYINKLTTHSVYQSFHETCYPALKMIVQQYLATKKTDELINKNKEQ